MKIKYDPGADAMYTKFREGEYEISEEIREGLIIDFDNKKIGIRITDMRWER